MAKKQKSASEKDPVSNQSKTASPAALKFDAFVRLDTWLSSRSRWIVIVFFALALVIHGLFVQQTKNTPLTSQLKWEGNDMAFFDQSARHIAAGDWWCDTVLHPYHSWHDTYAREYFDKYPETSALYYARHVDSTGHPDSLAARREMINELYQGKVYHQEPFYVYLLALTFKVFGTDPYWVYMWQLLLSALTVVLIYLVAKRYFGASVGLLGSIFVLFSGPIMVYDVTFLRTTLTGFLTFLLLFLYQKLLDKNDRKSQLLFGAAGGIALLTQSYFMFFLSPALIWYIWCNRQMLVSTGIKLGVVVGAMLLVMSPLFIRNIKVGVPMTAMASNGAITYILFNSSNAKPLEASYMHVSSTVQLMHDSDGKLLPAAVACLKSFNTFGDILKLYKNKIYGLLMWYEVPNNMNYYLYKEFSPLLNSLPAPYRLLAPLGICGLFFAFWRFRWTFTPFFLMLLSSAAPMFISASLARYRIPFVMLMSVLAAFFLLLLFRSILTAKWKESLVGITLIGLSWFLTDNIRDQRFFRYYPNDIMMLYKLGYQDKLTELEKNKDDQGYEQLTTDLLQYIPDFFHTIRSDHQVYSNNEADCCEAVSHLFDMHAAVLKANGNNAKSAQYAEKSQILNKLSNDFHKKVGR